MLERVAFRCDVGAETGVGHLMRCLALAEELADRGVEPTFLCAADSVPWAGAMLADRGFVTTQPPASPAELGRSIEGRYDAVVLDSYRLSAEEVGTVRAVAPVVLSVVDGARGVLDADVLVDQNLGAEGVQAAVPSGAVRLAGLRYVLLRDDVRRLRPARPDPVGDPARAPEVLVVFGGTDPYHVGAAAVGLLAVAGLPFRATVVAPTDRHAREASEVALAIGQEVRTVPPTDALAELIRRSDLVVGAAGSSTWELLALGACAALVCVADNQADGYRRSLRTGAAIGLGSVEDIRRASPATTSVVADLLASPERRAAVAATGWDLVDGRGRERVADVLAERHAAVVRPGPS